jgi:hypothetical protein
MRNINVRTAAIVSAALLLSGCQRTFHLSPPPAATPVAIPTDAHFQVYGANDSQDWAGILGALAPAVVTSGLYTADSNANFVILRVTETEPNLVNLPLALPALTICIIPCHQYKTYTADFEVYLAQSRARGPTRFHYQFSAISGTWLLRAKSRPDPAAPVRALYRQFFSDYAELLNTSPARDENHE